jgi:Ca2+-binding RTX toxin-like protein
MPELRHPELPPIGLVVGDAGEILDGPERARSGSIHARTGLVEPLRRGNIAPDSDEPHCPGPLVDGDPGDGPHLAAAGGALRCRGADERIFGTNRADVIVGGDGRDHINGKGGKDRICGGDRFDRLIGGPGGDRVRGEANTDNLFGGGEGDLLIGGDRVDIMWPGPWKDIVRGGVHKRDMVRYSGAAQGVTVNLATGVATGEGRDELAGIEIVLGSRHSDSLIGDAHNNHLLAIEGRDGVFGGGGEDKITGGSGDDTGAGPVVGLDGGGGDDQIYGGLATTC